MAAAALAVMLLAPPASTRPAACILPECRLSGAAVRHNEQRYAEHSARARSPF